MIDHRWADILVETVWLASVEQIGQRAFREHRDVLLIPPDGRAVDRVVDVLVAIEREWTMDAEKFKQDHIDRKPDASGDEYAQVVALVRTAHDNLRAGATLEAEQFQRQHESHLKLIDAAEDAALKAVAKIFRK